LAPDRAESSLIAARFFPDEALARVTDNSAIRSRPASPRGCRSRFGKTASDLAIRDQLAIADRSLIVGRIGPRRNNRSEPESAPRLGYVTIASKPDLFARCSRSEETRLALIRT
jgi:hypothetical protein